MTPIKMTETALRLAEWRVTEREIVRLRTLREAADLLKNEGELRAAILVAALGAR